MDILRAHYSLEPTKLDQLNFVHILFGVYRGDQNPLDPVKNNSLDSKALISRTSAANSCGSTGSNRPHRDRKHSFKGRIESFYH